MRVNILYIYVYIYIALYKINSFNIYTNFTEILKILLKWYSVPLENCIGNTGSGKAKKPSV